jgi:hypothetical protein
MMHRRCTTKSCASAVFNAQCAYAVALGYARGVLESL